MKWFEKQLRYREEVDNANFDSAIVSIAGAVMGTHLQEALSQKEIVASAIDEILRFYHCEFKNDEIPSQIKTIEEQIEYRIRPFGLKCRTVTLDEDWYNYAVGAMIGTLKEDGSAIALLPEKFSGYSFVNIKTGEKTKINRKNINLLDKEAICFYQPFPLKVLNIGDLMKFMMQQLSIFDIVLYIVLLGISSSIGLVLPWLTKLLFSDVLESGSVEVLLALVVFMVCYSVSKLCFDLYQNLINSKIYIKEDLAVQAAVMNRIMSLQPSFFKNFSAGELAQRSMYVQSLCKSIFNIVGITGLTSIFSLIYIGQIFTFTPTLVLPSLIIIIITVVLSLISTFLQMKISRERMQLSSKTSGLVYSMITGIQKIKLAGAEKRMFSRWARQYAKEAQLEYNPPIFLKLSATINLSLSIIGSLIIYAISIKSQISVANYYAFNASYAMVSSAFMSVVSIANIIANIKPTLEMVCPIMEAEPEKHDGKENIAELYGEIELSHISFRYNESMPNVIDDLSLKINPGEYLAIVGATGCGKSTLMRLILGFETPQKGSIFFDGKDIAKIDLESLRRQIGSVIQNGKLFYGDIYSNIVITAPQLTVDEAWEAAEIASLADDIRNMPMGMNTIISEGQGGISGGQCQRLMIARAVAPKPKILFFDEATSALDNITQKKVSEAIDSLKCTRIVIAHRLSTIQHADRIIYLYGGKIVEEGTYEELINKNGYFAKLVERQRLDIDVE